jgi:hypothetical protein
MPESQPANPSDGQDANLPSRQFTILPASQSANVEGNQSGNEAECQPANLPACQLVKAVHRTGRRLSVSARCLDILHAAESAMREKGAIKPLEGLGASEILDICLELVVARIPITDWKRLRDDIRKGKRG